MALPAAAAAERVMVRVDPHNVVVLDQRTSRGPNLILTLLVLAALLLLIGIAALASVQWNPLQLVIPASTATTNATLVSTSVSTVPATAAPAGSSTASTGTPVVATPTSLTSVTATPGGPPTLSVDQTQFTQLLCLGPLGASIHFQVLNSGGGSLAWTANPSDNVSPASGSLAHNEPQTVTVSMILLSRSITISAIGAQDSPQTVTITCRA